MDEEIENMKKKMKEILQQCNIKISISGCGCCGSPWVSFEKDGVKIVNDLPEFNIDMFENDFKLKN